MAHAGGRPKITPADFPEGWQETVLDLMKAGASKMEVYAMLNISDVTFARLMREDKEFLRTIKKGERLSQAWWEMAGRTQLRNKEFNYTGWYMNMKNRFNWADKQEVKTEVSGQLDTSPANPEMVAKFTEFLKGETKA